jgi:hypothetical protein
MKKLLCFIFGFTIAMPACMAVKAAAVPMAAPDAAITGANPFMVFEADVVALIGNADTFNLKSRAIGTCKSIPDAKTKVRLIAEELCAASWAAETPAMGLATDEIVPGTMNILVEENDTEDNKHEKVTFAVPALKHWIGYASINVHTNYDDPTLGVVDGFVSINKAGITALTTLQSLERTDDSGTIQAHLTMTCGNCYGFSACMLGEGSSQTGMMAAGSKAMTTGAADCYGIWALRLSGNNTDARKI